MMKKMIKKIALKTILMGSIIAVSCSDSSEDQLTENYPKFDYHLVYTGYTDDIAVLNGESYYIFKSGSDDSDSGILPSIRKVDSKGETTTLKDLHNFFGNRMGICTSNSSVYFTTDNFDKGKSIYKITPPNYDYTSYDINQNTSQPARVNTIESLNDNSMVFFEYSTYSIIRYFPDIATDVIIAGSGQPTMKDGVGESAGFKYVSAIAVNKNNNDLYVVDDNKNIRKLESITHTQFKVTTLLSNNDTNITDIEIDNNGNVLVMIFRKGIYKLNEQNVLEQYLTKKIIAKQTDNNFISNIDFKGFEKFKIIDNDLYLLSNRHLTKISNYKSELKL